MWTVTPLPEAESLTSWRGLIIITNNTNDESDENWVSQAFPSIFPCGCVPSQSMKLLHLVSSALPLDLFQLRELGTRQGENVIQWLRAISAT